MHFIVTYNNFTEARSKQNLICPFQKMSCKKLFLSDFVEKTVDVDIL